MNYLFPGRFDLSINNALPRRMTASPVKSRKFIRDVIMIDSPDYVESL